MKMTPCLRWAWLLIPLAATALLVWSNVVRIQHINAISAIAPQAPVIDPESPTGYASATRRLIANDQNLESLQWIIETQQMFAERTWRPRHSDADNWPDGRAVTNPSAYRWWLGMLAWIDQRFTAHPIGLCVERTALYADPVIHLLLLITTVLFVARQFGALPSALAAVGLVAVFPFAGAFLPGVPTTHGLSAICAFWSVLLLASGLRVRNAPHDEIHAEGVESPVHHWRGKGRLQFMAAGVAGGLGLWIDSSGQLFVTAGILVGGFLTTRAGPLRRPEAARADPSPTPWMDWAIGGAVTCCGAYLLENFPDRMAWLPSGGVHPIHALGLLGAGELLRQADAGTRSPPWFRNRIESVRILMAGLLLAGSIAALVTRGGLAADLFDWRLTNQPDSPIFSSLLAWLAREGFRPPVRATLLPMLLLAPAFWLLFPEKVRNGRHLEIAVLLGPALFVTGLACFQLRAWNLVDAVLLAILVVMTAPSPDRSAHLSFRRNLSWSVFCGFLFLVGLPLLVPPASTANPDELTPFEARSLVERDLAHWLAGRTHPEPAVVFAPPQTTAALTYFGSLHGIGTMYPNNDDGISAAVRLAGSTSFTEAAALAEKLGVTHAILPSWDPGLDDFARIGSGSPGGTFMAALHRWELPPWIRPVAYPSPQIPDWEQSSVIVFEVVEEQEEADAVSRLAEYFLEMGRIEQASSHRSQLENYPASLGALAALAQIEMARGDAAAFAQVFRTVVLFTEGGAAHGLSWDRRVSLAIVLTQGRRRDLAVEQVRQCLDQIDRHRLLSLTPSSLYRFLLLCRRFELEIADPALRERAYRELPPELRQRLLGGE